MHPGIGKTGPIGPSAAPARPPRTSRAPAARSFVEVLSEGVKPQAATAPGKPAGAVAPAAAAQPSRAQAASPIKRILQNAIDSERKLDGILAAASSGRSFSPQELIGMQAEVFRYSQTVELVSRAADRVVGAVKQTLGTQV